MFFGEYDHTLDLKGRVNMPAKFRDELGEKFYITKGLDHCLFVFPESEWKIFEEKLKSLPLTNQDARAFVRLFFAGASEMLFDKQGRMIIPQPLRDHAALDKNLKIIGVGTRIEIWSDVNWTHYNSPENISFDEIAEKMAELGI